LSSRGMTAQGMPVDWSACSVCPCCSMLCLSSFRHCSNCMQWPFPAASGAAAAGPSVKATCWVLLLLACVLLLEARSVSMSVRSWSMVLDRAAFVLMLFVAFLRAPSKDL
jgi:hypothetical protein